MRDRYLFTIVSAGCSCHDIRFRLCPSRRQTKKSKSNQHSKNASLSSQWPPVWEGKRWLLDTDRKADCHLVMCKPVWKWHRALGANWKPTIIYLAWGNFVYRQIHKVSFFCGAHCPLYTVLIGFNTGRRNQTSMTNYGWQGTRLLKNWDCNPDPNSFSDFNIRIKIQLNTDSHFYNDNFLLVEVHVTQFNQFILRQKEL